MPQWEHTYIVNKDSPINPMRFFPPNAYVAPYTPGEVVKYNTIQMVGRKFVFLDTGNFYSNHTTFGVIWGNHVYLCNYKGQHEPTKPASTSSSRLDARFFAALGGIYSDCYEVLESTSALWASESDFDWDTLYLIVPDLHLMKESVAETWHKKSFGNPFGHYSFDIELKLLALAQTLQNNMGQSGDLRSHVKVVQIGDSYDLWVGCEPRLFQENETREMRLEPTIKGERNPTQTPLQRVVQWINEIRDSGPREHAKAPSTPSSAAGAPAAGPQHATIPTRNPAVEALDVLEATFGEIVYIYGNHDNYLIIDEVCAAAGLKQRKRWQSYPGIFIEHAHRMEAKFTDPRSSNSILGARNYDGDPSGFYNTNLLYKILNHSTQNIDPDIIFAAQYAKDYADNTARNHDQPQYEMEFARIWLGREVTKKNKPPHIFVIGHTHIPNLLEIHIEPWRIEQDKQG